MSKHLLSYKMNAPLVTLVRQSCLMKNKNCLLGDRHLEKLAENKSVVSHLI